MLGSISHGTMRNEDLIPTFLWKLEVLDKTERDAIVKRYKYDLEGFNFDSENADYMIHELFDALDDVALPYTYFGAHEGDGSDYGFWISHYAIEADLHCGEILQLDDYPDEEDLGEYDYYLVVNDHGNMTLLNDTGSEVWACV